jgi:hypothetical protein
MEVNGQLVTLLLRKQSQYLLEGRWVGLKVGREKISLLVMLIFVVILFYLQSLPAH